MESFLTPPATSFMTPLRIGEGLLLSEPGLIPSAVAMLRGSVYEARAVLRVLHWLMLLGAAPPAPEVPASRHASLYPTAMPAASFAAIAAAAPDVLDCLAELYLAGVVSQSGSQGGSSA